MRCWYHSEHAADAIEHAAAGTRVTRLGDAALVVPPLEPPEVPEPLLLVPLLPLLPLLADPALPEVRAEAPLPLEEAESPSCCSCRIHRSTNPALSCGNAAVAPPLMPICWRSAAAHGRAADAAVVRTSSSTASARGIAAVLPLACPLALAAEDIWRGVCWHAVLLPSWPVAMRGC